MAIVVSLVGLAIAGVGLVGAFQPGRLMDFMQRFVAAQGFAWAIGIRVALGAVFLWLAPQCRLPELVRVLGIVSLVAAVALALMGPTRFRSLVGWWLERPAGFVRGWALVAVAFGVLLVAAGA